MFTLFFLVIKNKERDNICKQTFSHDLFFAKRSQRSNILFTNSHHKIMVAKKKAAKKVVKKAVKKTVKKAAKKVVKKVAKKAAKKTAKRK